MLTFIGMNKGCGRTRMPVRKGIFSNRSRDSRIFNILRVITATSVFVKEAGAFYNLSVDSIAGFFGFPSGTTDCVDTEGTNSSTAAGTNVSTSKTSDRITEDELREFNKKYHADLRERLKKSAEEGVMIPENHPGEKKVNEEQFPVKYSYKSFWDHRYEKVDVHGHPIGLKHEEWYMPFHVADYVFQEVLNVRKYGYGWHPHMAKLPRDADPEKYINVNISAIPPLCVFSDLGVGTSALAGDLLHMIEWNPYVYPWVDGCANETDALGANTSRRYNVSVHGVDFSEPPIKAQLSHYKNGTKGGPESNRNRGLEFSTFDIVTDWQYVQNGVLDFVFNKGTLDCLFASDNPTEAAQALLGIYQTMRPENSIFLDVSHSDLMQRQNMLQFKNSTIYDQLLGTHDQTMPRWDHFQICYRRYDDRVDKSYLSLFLMFRGTHWRPLFQARAAEQAKDGNDYELGMKGLGDVRVPNLHRDHTEMLECFLDPLESDDPENETVYYIVVPDRHDDPAYQDILEAEQLEWSDDEIQRELLRPRFHTEKHEEGWEHWSETLKKKRNKPRTEL